MKSYLLYFMFFLLSLSLFVGHASFSQSSSPPSASNVRDDNRVSDKPLSEESMAAQFFIERINEARKHLAMRHVELTRQKIIAASNLLPLISQATPAQRRLTRVEFGGGFYANDLEERKSYYPIETQSLESLTRSTGPRWVKTTRTESDAKIIYITLNLSGGKAQTYLDLAKKKLVAGDIKGTDVQLAELTDQIIKVDDAVPAVIQARDYITLADNYIQVSNFFGAKNSLEKASSFLDKMTNEDIYKPHHSDIIALRKNIEGLQTAFSKLDADQIKNAGVNLKKWRQQLAGWSGE